MNNVDNNILESNGFNRSESLAKIENGSKLMISHLMKYLQVPDSQSTNWIGTIFNGLEMLYDVTNSNFWREALGDVRLLEKIKYNAFETYNLEGNKDADIAYQKYSAIFKDILSLRNADLVKEVLFSYLYNTSIISTINKRYSEIKNKYRRDKGIKI